jgi:hypothetical protein
MKPATRPSVKRGGTPDNRLHHATIRDGSLFIPLIFHRCNRREDFALRAQKRAFMGIFPKSFFTCQTAPAGFGIGKNRAYS